MVPRCADQVRSNVSALAYRPPAVGVGLPFGVHETWQATLFKRFVACIASHMSEILWYNRFRLEPASRRLVTMHLLLCYCGLCIHRC